MAKSPEEEMSSRQSDSSEWVSVFSRQMDEMMSIVCHMKAQGGNLHEFSPLMDIYETAGHFVIEMDLPGFAEADFSVAVRDQSIRIDGCKRHRKKDSVMSYICLERHFGRFTRTIEVPPEFDPAAMQKTYSRGVLSLHLPRH
jgi:HSP20 family protein